ncbi:MAG: helix-turn-helix transcriptional regulator [Acidimicrobiales bacterium]
MTSVAPYLAEGLRRGLLVGEATDPDLPDAPGIAVLDRRGELESLSPTAERWIAALPDPQIGRGLPASVASVAASAFDRVSGGRPDDESTALVRTVDGQWLSLHGTVIGVDGHPRTAVIIEPARRDRVALLLMAIYGLTSREREVTLLVLRGGSTAELAVSLGISPRARRLIGDEPPCLEHAATAEVHVLPSHLPPPGMGVLPINAYVLHAEEAQCSGPCHQGQGKAQWIRRCRPVTRICAGS